MTGELQDKVAVVTGGGTGIGEAVARRLHREGAKVVLGGRRLELVQRVASELGGKAVACDVSVEAEVADMFAAAMEAYGRVDILVNNAGFGGGGLMSAEAVDIDVWDQTFAVNTRGVMLCVKHAIPSLRQQGGTIVNVASIAGLKAVVRQIAYGASKAAVINMTQSIAFEVGKFGIRINSICPGAVVTDLYRGNAAARGAEVGASVEDDQARISSNSALGRLTTCEDVASGVYFLASGNSGSMTGAYVQMDAGKF
ncbi:MAG: SDR family oxidoreductase [Rhodobacteraceae bacterium]|nr:SDR family oxidoreductase [Paracoccaceae bacterium]MCY4138282.1 SDR family oxidoreductase [Paracoccaceae bacterium]